MGPESLHVNKAPGNAHATALWLTFSVAAIYVEAPRGWSSDHQNQHHPGT